MFSTVPVWSDGLSWEREGLVQTLHILPVLTNFSRVSQTCCFSQWPYALKISGLMLLKSFPEILNSWGFYLLFSFFFFFRPEITFTGEQVCGAQSVMLKVELCTLSIFNTLELWVLLNSGKKKSITKVISSTTTSEGFNIYNRQDFFWSLSGSSSSFSK